MRSKITKISGGRAHIKYLDAATCEVVEYCVRMRQEESTERIWGNQAMIDEMDRHSLIASFYRRRYRYSVKVRLVLTLNPPALAGGSSDFQSQLWS